jgi:ribosomal-protein-alanine N-acetyltransferase
MLPTTLPRLQGDRIELRCMRESDALALLDIYGDPAVTAYTDEKPFENVATVFLMLDSVQRLLRSGESLEWAIVPVGSDTPIGTCGIHSLDEALKKAEVGCLLKQSAWGKGYMKEAVNLLMVYARESLGLRYLAADVHADNKRARQLFRTLGFRQDSPESWIMDLADQPS